MSADPLEHKVPRHVPGEQYEKAYDLANRRGKQVIKLRQKLAESEAALAESRGELKDLRDLVLAYKAERDADEWGDDEALLARQMYARQRLFRAAAGSPDA